MLFRWWLFSALAPLMIADMLLRNSPLYPGLAWPIGLEYLASEY